jgi:hypothetical protein
MQSQSFKEPMTRVLRDEMQDLGIQSKSVSRKAGKNVRGKWYSGVFLLNLSIKKRNLDIGIDDGYVSPFLLPAVDECPDLEPKSYPSPSLESLSKYGFSLDVKFEPRIWERNKILEIVYSKNQRKPWIDPEKHLALIMKYIRKQAEGWYGPDAYTP